MVNENHTSSEIGNNTLEVINMDTEKLKLTSSEIGSLWGGVC